jgi:hypothetical protein
MTDFPCWYAQCLIACVRSLNIPCIEYLLAMLPSSPLVLPPVQGRVREWYASDGKSSVLSDMLKVCVYVCVIWVSFCLFYFVCSFVRLLV